MSRTNKIFFSLILVVGLYIAFLPNKFSQASFLNFLGKDNSSEIDQNETFDLQAFSKIPVLRGGRVKPLDSVARNILLVLRNKRTALRVLEQWENEKLELIQSLKKEGNELTEEQSKFLKNYFKNRKTTIPQGGIEVAVTEVDAIDWLAQVLFAPEKADKLKTFLIDHDQVLGLVNQKLLDNGKFFSYEELEPFLSNIDSSARKAGEVETELRDSFQQNIIELYRSLLIYKKLKHALSPPTTPDRPEVLEQLGVTDLVYSEEKDSARSDEYVRFRKLTAELAKDSSVVNFDTSLAYPTSLLVTPDIAETTTITLFPKSSSFLTFLATFFIFSISPTEVPPNF